MFRIFKINYFKNKIIEALKLTKNDFHPLVHILGTPDIGKGTYIGLYSEINANKSVIKIGENCDIASFVSINCADSHKFAIGIAKNISRKKIIIEDNVFIGSHSFIGGGIKIGHNSVVGAGTILINGGDIPPYSLVVGNPPIIKKGYYEK